ncbi:MAG: hypothetical protein JWP75_3431 [Frondihabitans sp.]|nr:hypothetical protein [Frondihabitans sp.]
MSVPSEVAARMGITRGGARALDPSNPYATTRIRGTGAGIAAAVRAQTPAQRRAGLGLVVPGSANDPMTR